MFARIATIGAVVCLMLGCPPGEGLNGGVNNLNCPPGSQCDWDCNGGVCNIECDSESICDVGCNGGVCNLRCRADATCDFSCNGGVCNFKCDEGSICYSEGVRPINDAGAGGAGGGEDPDAGVGGAGGAGGEGGGGGVGGGHDDLPVDCPGLCAALDAETAACAQSDLSGRDHDLSLEGCTDLSDEEGCVACLNHLEVPAEDCAAAARVCL